MYSKHNFVADTKDGEGMSLQLNICDLWLVLANVENWVSPLLRSTLCKHISGGVTRFLLKTG